jgi:hypothetical protein
MKKNQPPVYDSRSDLRLMWLKKFIEDECRGSRAEMCKKYDFTDSDRSLLYQISGPNPTRGFGDTTARRWEQKMALPSFWFDRHPGQVLVSENDAKGALDPLRLDKLPRDKREILEGIAEMLLAPHEGQQLPVADAEHLDDKNSESQKQ